MDAAWSDASPQSQQGQGRKKRIRKWTPDDRAKHKVEEKTRREAFNQSLTDLALLLPSLANANEPRPSKHIIVHESLKYHRVQQANIERLVSGLDRLLVERRELLAEVNDWRRSCNLEPRQAAVEVPANPCSPTTSPSDHGDVLGAFITSFGYSASLMAQPPAAAAAVAPSVAAPVPHVPPNCSADLFAPVSRNPEIDFDRLATQTLHLRASHQPGWPTQREGADIEHWLPHDQLWTEYDTYMPQATPNAIY